MCMVLLLEFEGRIGGKKLYCFLGIVVKVDEIFYLYEVFLYFVFLF